MMMGGRLEANVEEDLFKARTVNFFPNSLYNLLIMIYSQLAHCRLYCQQSKSMHVCIYI